jgi:hypothetical protein
MSESPYADAILDYLADQEPHTIAEIHAAIGASDGAGITQLLRNLMTTLSLARDPRKLVNHHEGRTLYYRIIARNPRNPLPEPVPERDNLKMKERIYSIRDWDEHYENSRSRRVESLRWVPVPNKHDGEGYGLVMEQDDAAELFAAWVLILQVASKCSTRGTLAREDGTAMSARTLAAKTRAPEAWFSRALEFFSVNVLWLECHQGDTQVSPKYHSSDTQVTPICPSSADRREGKGIEEKGIEKNPLTPKGGGKSAQEVRLQSFEAFWQEYPKKRGKGDAEKSWLKINPSLPAVLAALEWQRESKDWLKDQGQFIPNPATYINQRRWMDEPTTTRRSDAELAF